MLPPRRACLATVAIAAILAPGCQRNDDTKKRRRETRVAKVKKPVPPIRLLSEAVVTRGKEPHRLLRYRRSDSRFRFSRGVTATLSEIENTKKKKPLELPEVTQRFTVSWGAPGLLEVAAAEPEVATGKSPAETKVAREQIRRFRSLVAGRSAQLKVDDRGLISDAGSLKPELARRELVASLVDAIVPLPEVPVGVGAKWRIERAIPRARTFVKQTATYTLEGFEGDRLIVAVDLLTVGERQPINLSGPLESTSELLALRVFQKGKLTVDLGSATAMSGTLERSDTIHVRTTLRQKTLRDYFAQGQSEVSLETVGQKVARPGGDRQRE